MTTTVLAVPGLGNSDAKHWQSRWCDGDPDYHIVQQDDWDKPNLEDWLERLSEQVALFETPVFLVAHSLGCALIAHWSSRDTLPATVKGVFLVAPADVDRETGIPEQIKCFAPIPLMRFPIPSLVIASNNDPYVDINRASHFAEHWGSRLINIGDQGHINTDSGHGDWPEGKALLLEFIQVNS